MIIIILRSITVLGPLTVIHVAPSYQVFELINIADILTRLESMTTLVLIITIFVKTSIFFYATVLSIAELLNLSSYKPIVTPLGIIIICLSVLIFDNAIDESVVAANIYPIFVIPIQMFIPILTLILSKKYKEAP
jgi:spore germination protein KB